MITLFYDCESTGLWHPQLPHDDPTQPRLLQLAYKLVDEQRKRLARGTFLVKPNNWTIEPEAEDHHHITEAMASRAGLDVIEVLRPFLQTAAKAHKIVAHNNHGYDRLLIYSEIVRNGFNPGVWQKRAPDMQCTMEMAKPVMKMPGQYVDFKFPSLEEAHDFFIPSMAPYTSLHDGESDTDACERIFWAILDREAHASQC